MNRVCITDPISGDGGAAIEAETHRSILQNRLTGERRGWRGDGKWKKESCFFFFLFLFSCIACPSMWNLDRVPQASSTCQVKSEFLNRQRGGFNNKQADYWKPLNIKVVQKIFIWCDFPNWFWKNLLLEVLEILFCSNKKNSKNCRI